MIIIAKETPHMFMWFSDGAKIPDGISPLPQNARYNYIKRLKDECAKLLLTQTPAYLVYMGRLLNNEQKRLLTDLEKEIPNLAVIDYDEVEQSIADKNLISKVAKAAKSYKEQEKLEAGIGGIAELVDFTRLILLYNSNILRKLAHQKIKSQVKWQQGLIYRDFDVTLEKETMPDIPTQKGYMATLNFLEKIHASEAALIRESKGNEDLVQKIRAFFNTHIYDLEIYQKNLCLFANRELTEEQQKAKDNIILEFKKISSEDFISTFINQIFIENSFLAINTDNHPLIAQVITKADKINTPYGAVQRCFGKGLTKIESIQEYLTPQIIGFNIGNDLTWKINVKQQHQLEPPNNGNEAKNQEIVDKLSLLTQKYLSHLEDGLKKKPHALIKTKHTIVVKLNSILQDASSNASAKLLQFTTTLTEADQRTLKNHREPSWLTFKRTVLFLLACTLIGAIIGGIDYLVRGHHSFFGNLKSHGERFILDIEESAAPQGRGGT